MQTKNKFFIHKTSWIILIMFLFTLISIPQTETKAEDAAPSGVKVDYANAVDKIKILEIAPGNSYKITAGSQLNSPVEEEITVGTDAIVVTHMSMSEFISKVDDIAGFYDVVVMSNEVNANMPSSYDLNKPFRQYTNPLSQAATGYKLNEEYHSENDITKKRAKEIINMINKGQLVYIDESILNNSALKDSNIVNIFSGTDTQGIGNGINTKTNYIKTSRSALSIENIIAKFKQNGNVKPQINYIYKPKSEERINSTVTNERQLNYTISSKTGDTGKIRFKLYLDVNGDGLYTEDELYLTKDDIGSIDYKEYSFQYKIPKNFVGYLDWKVDIIKINSDQTEGVKSSITSNVVMKAQNGKKQINVLQIYPDDPSTQIYGGKVTINTVLTDNSNFNDLLHSLDDYDILIDNIKVLDFCSQYGGSDGKAKLESSYDMIIIGFSDNYNSKDFTSQIAMENIASFIKDGNSVMFTHDTMASGLLSGESSKGAVQLTKYFRDYVGQARYKDPYRASETDIMKTYDEEAGTYVEKTIPHDVAKSSQTLGQTLMANVWEKTYATFVRQINNAQITNYPYDLGNLNTGITDVGYTRNTGTVNINTTHTQWFQLNLEDPDVVPWYNIIPIAKDGTFNSGDSRNFYYTYSKGNITYSGTGHRGVGKVNSAIPTQELKLFVNTIVKSYRGGNHAPDLENSVQEISDDLTSANKVVLENGSQYSKEVKKGEDFQFITIPTDPDIDRLKVSVTADGKDVSNLKINGTEESVVGKLVNPETEVKVTIPMEIYKDKVKGDIFQVVVKVQDDMGVITQKSFTLKVGNQAPTLKNFKIDALNTEIIDGFNIANETIVDGTNLNGKEDFQFITIPSDEDGDDIKLTAESNTIGYSQVIEANKTGDKVKFTIPKEKLKDMSKGDTFDVVVTAEDVSGDKYLETFTLMVANHAPSVQNLEITDEDVIPNGEKSKNIMSFGNDYKFVAVPSDIDTDDELKVEVTIKDTENNAIAKDISVKKAGETESKSLQDSIWKSGDKLELTIPKDKTLFPKNAYIQVLVKVTDKDGESSTSIFIVEVGPNNPPTLVNKEGDTDEIIGKGSISKNAIIIGSNYIFKTIPKDVDGDLLKVTVSVLDGETEKTVLTKQNVLAGTEIFPITIEKSHYAAKLKGETFDVKVKAEDTDGGSYEESFKVQIQDNLAPSLNNYESDGTTGILNGNTSITSPVSNNVVDLNEKAGTTSFEGKDFKFVTIPEDSDDDYVRVFVKIKRDNDLEPIVVKTILNAKSGEPLDVTLERELFKNVGKGETFEVYVTVKDADEPIVSEENHTQTKMFNVEIQENKLPDIKNYTAEHENIDVDGGTIKGYEDYNFITLPSDPDDSIVDVKVIANGNNTSPIEVKDVEVDKNMQVKVDKSYYSEIAQDGMFNIEVIVTDKSGGQVSKNFKVKVDRNHPPTLNNYTSKSINKVDSLDYADKNTTPVVEETEVVTADKNMITENSIADTIKAYKDYRFIVVPSDEDELDNKNLTVSAEASGVSLESKTGCTSGNEVIMRIPMDIYKDMSNNSEFEVKVTVTDLKGESKTKAFKLKVATDNAPTVQNEKINSDENDQEKVIPEAGEVKTMKYKDYIFDVLVNDLDDKSDEEGDKMTLKVMAGDTELKVQDGLSDGDRVQVTIPNELYDEFNLEDYLEITSTVTDSHGKQGSQSYKLMIVNYTPEIANKQLKDGNKEIISAYYNAIDAQKNAIIINKYNDFTFYTTPTDKNEDEPLKVSVTAQMETNGDEGQAEKATLSFEGNVLSDTDTVKSGSDIQVTIPKSVYEYGIPNTYIHIVSKVEDEFGVVDTSDFYVVIDDIKPSLYHGVLKQENGDDVVIDETTKLIRNYEKTNFAGRITNVFLKSKDTPLEVKLQTADQIEVSSDVSIYRGDVSIYRIASINGEVKKSDVWKMTYDEENKCYYTILDYSTLTKLASVESEGMTLIVKYSGTVNEKSTTLRKDYANKLFTKQLEKDALVYTQDVSPNELPPLF